MAHGREYTMYTHESLRGNQEGIADLCLTVEICRFGFSFSLQKTHTQEYVAAGRVPVALGGSFRRVLERLVNFFETTPILTGLRFSHTEIIYLNRCFTFLPFQLFDADKQSDLLSFAMGRQVVGRVLCETDQATDTVCIFSVREEFARYFLTRSDEVRERHSAAVFLQNALANAPLGRSIHANAVGEYLQVVVVEDGCTVLANIFRLEKEADFMYYLLLCANRTGTDEVSTPFVLYGDPQVYVRCMGDVNRCLRNYRFAARVPGCAYSPALDFVAGYDWYNVLNRKL